ncbi:MAG: DUF2726 domain-containing protein [Firmicutes bacterium]|nr:DUF2726 domain-containing protein [Bacillota bacterium]
MSKENAGCLSIILPFLKLFTKETKEEEKFPYAIRDDFLSEAEKSFLKVLNQAIYGDMIICPKVNLKDIFFVSSKNEKMKYINKINRKHVDFLLCKKDTLKPLCGIELDDSSHNRKDRIERDNFVNKVFKTAKLPLIRVKNKNSYTVNELKENINIVLKKNKIERKADSTVKESVVPICPKCKTKMVKRTATRGKYKGNEFWGCTNYPKCKETKEI